MSQNAIHSNKAPEPVGAYPHAKRVGPFLFLSGVGPRERGTKKIPGVELAADGTIASYDIEAQCHSVFKNVRNILEDSGYTLGRSRRCHRLPNEHESGFPDLQPLVGGVFQRTIRLAAQLLRSTVCQRPSRLNLSASPRKRQKRERVQSFSAENLDR